MNKTEATAVFDAQSTRDNVAVNGKVLTIKNGVVRGGKYYDITVIFAGNITQYNNDQIEKIKQTYALLINELKTTPDKAAFHTNAFKTSYFVGNKAYEKADQLARKVISTFPNEKKSRPSNESGGETRLNSQQTLSILQMQNMTFHDAIRKGIVEQVTTDAPQNAAPGVRVKASISRSPGASNIAPGDRPVVDKQFLQHMDRTIYKDLPFSAFVDGLAGKGARNGIDVAKFAKLLAALRELRTQQGVAQNAGEVEMRNMCKGWYAEALKYYHRKCGNQVEAMRSAQSKMSLLGINTVWLQDNSI